MKKAILSKQLCPPCPPVYGVDSSGQGWEGCSAFRETVMRNDTQIAEKG